VRRRVLYKICKKCISRARAARVRCVGVFNSYQELQGRFTRKGYLVCIVWYSSTPGTAPYNVLECMLECVYTHLLTKGPQDF
jgi:hypothetical protein